ncbi:MAG: N-acetylmuramoyl-L-alanine amidase [Eubacteriales bacterium]|nr:N-acetylmuramoyl-L-alanine amidase [Eubacteriales bacterium]
MHKMKKIMSYTLVAAMIMGGLAPGQLAKAAEEQSTTEVVKTEQATTEITTEVVSTEQKTTEKTTEAPTTEKTTEAEMAEEEDDDEMVDTGLSPKTSKVVVLDPGHCPRHPGAAGHGLREEVVTMDIAIACRDYLENYEDVTVYMTREGSDCCEALGVGDCLSSRNNYAKKMGADFLVSMHINAGSSSTYGANVLTAYKSGYNDSIRVKTQKFGYIALDKLKELGIANKGLLLRRSENGTRYSNGMLSDYYSIVRRGVVQKIPSVIIEHGFISNASDCSRFFATKAKRKKVGQADAKAIIEYFGLHKLTLDGCFVEEDDATYYVDGDTVMCGWVKDEGKWYYFDRKTGKMKTGFVKVDGNSYYLSPNTGELVTGWFTVNNSRYLAKGNGVVVKNQAYGDGVYTYLFNSSGKQLKKGLHSVKDNVYYVDSKGHVVFGCIVKIGTKSYGFDWSGKQLFGYQKLNGSNYYFDEESGVMAKKSIIEVDGKKYYFGSEGKQKTGWIKKLLTYYYFDPATGEMVTGWKKINGKYYYFSKTSGKMQKKKWIGKYYVDENGVRTKSK